MSSTPHTAPGKIDPRVAVVTGASSGIGRATAHSLASRGMRLVLAARDGDTLESVASECRARGGDAIAVPTDVASDDALHALAATTIDHFGGFDVWINDAAVMAYGRLDEIPPDVYRRVIDVNLLAPIEASRIALEHFRSRGSGHLVNIGSLYGTMTSPLVGPYVVSKFGLLGFTEVLRQEVENEDWMDVSIVLPGSIDSPIFRHAANYSGRAVRPVPPVSDVRRVGEAVAALMDEPRPVAVVGATHRVMSWGRVLFPRLYDRLAAPVMRSAGLRPSPADDDPGNVFESGTDWNRLRGSWSRWEDLRAAGRGVVAIVKTLVARLRAVARSGRS